MTESGPAYEAGLRIGDKLLRVNECDLSNADHYEAVDVLKSAGKQIRMVILREVPKPQVVYPLIMTFTCGVLTLFYVKELLTVVSVISNCCAYRLHWVYQVFLQYQMLHP